ncbi:CLUMA_CG006996, isoform A [Clunio marinus]|uniref:CLUMA_CG006996, isoform A n=1 Tax=Clunio marinus TaxID=568069 RepID=A0A1J1I1J8_9DIPT|nr:CLUMA_CG006996, isoform A [Clunio marinus]
MFFFKHCEIRADYWVIWNVSFHYANNCNRSRIGKVKKKGPGSSLMQDLNFLSLKEFYNSIPDYSDINHLPEKEFYRELNNLKKKQQELTLCKKKDVKCKSGKSNSRLSNPLDYSIGHDVEVKRHLNERISFADDGNSISSWQMDFGSISCRKRENRNQSRLSSATSRPRTSRAESRCQKLQPSRLSNIQDDYDMLNCLKSFRSKSISPTRSQINDAKYQKAFDHDNKFYSDVTQDKFQSVEHATKRDPIKDIPITSRIPLFKEVMEDQKHK